MQVGDSVELLCGASADPAPQNIWMKKDGKHIDNTNVSLNTPNGSLILYNMGLQRGEEEEGRTELQYVCIAFNVAGAIS